MKTDIIVFAVCSMVILTAYICFFKWKETIYRKKPLQLIGSLIAVAIEGCAIWRGMRYIPPYPGVQVPAHPVLLWLIWLALGVVSGVCLLFYLKAFSNIIAPWRKL